jgi:hypothetical protein
MNPGADQESSVTVESDNLSVLRRMRSEGRISDDEFHELTRGLHADTEQLDVPAPDETHTTTVDGAEPVDRAAGSIRLRSGLSSAYVLSLGIGAALSVVAAASGLMSWLITVIIIALLATTLIEGARTLTTILGLLAASVVIAGLVSSFGGGAPQAVQEVAVTTPPAKPDPAAGSLGLYLDEVSDSWNTVETPPEIIKGLTRYNETGEYDTFIYRFGEWGRLAGAFDPDTEVVYALLATGWLSEPATTSLYLHLCHMTAPYSPECIEAYQEQGLGGGSLADFTDAAHQTEWRHGEHTWRLSIEDNVLTLRLFGADAA